MNRYQLVWLALLVSLLSSVTLAGDRVLRFPERSVGAIQVCPQQQTDYGFKPGFRREWADLGQAKGSVVVPDGMGVLLKVDATDDPHLEWLDQLPDDAFNAIRCTKGSVSAQGVERISRQKELRSLSAGWSNLSDACSKHLGKMSRLQAIFLSDNDDIGDRSMKSLATLPNLETIWADNTGISDLGLKHLASSSSLRSIHVGRNRITDRGVATLGDLENLASLSFRHLRFPRSRAVASAVSAVGIIEACRKGAIESLDVSGIRITDEDLAEVIAVAPSLKFLGISDTAITSSGLRGLKKLEQLDTLFCDGVHFDDVAAENLRNHAKLRIIRGDIRLTNRGVIALAQIRSLEAFELNGDADNRPDDACMDALASMPNLRKLLLSRTSITDAGFAKLASSPTLEFVWLAENNLTTKCVETLASFPSLKNVSLRSLGPRDDGKEPWSGLGALTQVSRSLWIGDCPSLSKRDYERLAKLGRLKSLTIVDGARDQETSAATDEGLAQIARMKSLERLTLTSAIATEAGLVALCEAPSIRWISIASPNLNDDAVKRVQEAYSGIERITLIKSKR